VSTRKIPGFITIVYVAAIQSPVRKQTRIVVADDYVTKARTNSGHFCDMRRSVNYGALLASVVDANALYLSPLHVGAAPVCNKM
jgi:hypothetical protein